MLNLSLALIKFETRQIANGMCTILNSTNSSDEANRDLNLYVLHKVVTPLNRKSC